MLHRPSLLIAAAVLAGCTSTSVGALRAPGARTATPTAWTPIPVPAAQLASLAGEPASIDGVADGRVALVSLWATWCDACEREIDALNRLQDATAAGRDAVVIGVDVGETAAAVGDFARRRGMRYALLLDERFELADAVGQRRLPCTLVVDRQGRIVFRGDALDAPALEALRRTIARGAP